MSPIRLRHTLRMMPALAAGIIACNGEKDPTAPASIQPDPLRFAAVGAGRERTCGVTVAGAAYCWGSNPRGQLGGGTATMQLTPVIVAGGVSFAAVSVARAGDHTCGLTATGAAYCWGANQAGQLGDGTSINRSRPVAVAGGVSFTALTAGGAHTCGLTAAGAAYCWGSNAHGQLGDGSTSQQLTPIPAAGGVSFATVSAGGGHTCGLTLGGAAYCWGFNSYGQLGDGTKTQRLTAVPAASSLSFAAVSAGGGHTCGLTATGAAYCWGHNYYGQLGDGTTTQRWSPASERLTPRLVGEGLSFVAVSAGGEHSCGINAAGAAYCWGYNFWGELGDGTTTDSQSPVLVAGGVSFASVNVGGEHTCAVTNGGAAYCWGYNMTGQLGDGTTKDRHTPARVLQ